MALLQDHRKKFFYKNLGDTNFVPLCINFFFPWKFMSPENSTGLLGFSQKICFAIYIVCFSKMTKLIKRHNDEILCSTPKA